MVLGSNKDKWLHPEEALVNGKVSYHVKFVGVTEVDDPRGMDVVRQAMQKLKFSRHIKRSEGTKPPKVDLTINVDGLQIIDQRTKNVLHSIPLQRVSFCADDKQDKRLFSFIAKGSDGKQYCYGFDSLHEANSITLTIGQAFELAYEKFLQSDKATTSKQVIELSKRIELLEKENSSLKQRINELESTQQQRSMYIPLSPCSQSAFRSPKHLSSSSAKQSSRNSLDSAITTDLISLDHDQSPLDTSSASHSSTNQKYLESKLTSEQLGRHGNGTKQSSIDHTIASIEKARASLNNLKEYARKKKLEKTQKTASQSQPKFDKLFPSASSNKQPPTFSQTLPLDAPPGNDLPTSYRLLPMPSPERYISKLSRQDSADRLSTEINDQAAADDIINLDIKPQESLRSMKTVEKATQSYIKPTSIKDLPETEIGDLFRLEPNESAYMNTTSKKLIKDEPPPLPPKPPSMLDPRPATDLLSSSSNTDLTSLDAMSGCSFTLWPIFDDKMEGESYPIAATYPSPPTDLVAATFNRFSGEDGYMALKSSLRQATCNPYIDSTYDSVFQLMESIRAAEMSDPNVPVKDVPVKRDPSSKSRHDNISGFSRFGKSIRSQRISSNVSASRKARTLPVLSRDNKLSTLCGSNPSPHVVSTSSFSNKHPLFSPTEKKFRLKTPPATTKKDAFDMPPFTPPPTTPPIVRLPSPNEVFPRKSPSRRSPFKSKDVFDQHLLDATNEPTTPAVSQNIFDKSPFFNNSSAPLDSFDPLKSP